MLDREKLLFTSKYFPKASFQGTLIHSHTMIPFDTSGKQAFENTVGKGEIACNIQFLLFPQCFLMFG